MRRLRAFGAFWYDFVIGDDWRVAVGVVVALGAVAGLVHGGVNAWWLVPVVVVGLLGFTLRGAARRP
jgi:ribose/xylose/arabinose/galactoside ABC-type transport system permease subunit